MLKRTLTFFLVLGPRFRGRNAAGICYGHRGHLPLRLRTEIGCHYLDSLECE